MGEDDVDVTEGCRLPDEKAVGFFFRGNLFPLNGSLTVVGKEATKEEAESASNVAGELGEQLLLHDF